MKLYASFIFFVLFSLSIYAQEEEEKYYNKDFKNLANEVFSFSPYKERSERISKNFKEKAKELLIYAMQIAQKIKNDIDNFVRPPADENEYYYDESRLPEFFYLNSALKIMLQVLKVKPELKDYINFEEAQDFVRVKNPDTKVLAIELISEIDSERSFDFLLNEKTTETSEVAKGKVACFLELKSRDDYLKRQKFLQYLEESFREDEGYTVMEIILNFSSMKFTQEEFSQIIQNLMDYKINPRRTHLWPMVYYKIINYHESHNFNLNLTSLCQEEQ